MRKQQNSGIIRIEMTMLVLLALFLSLALFQKSHDVDRIDHTKKAQSKGEK